MFGKAARLTRQLTRQYYEQYVAMGWPPVDAKAHAGELLRAARATYRAHPAAIREGGTAIGELLCADDGEADELVRARECLREEGVRPEDIRWWWNLHDLERCVLLQFDNSVRVAAFLQHQTRGAAPEEATAMVRESFPVYGTVDDVSKLSGQDRPLPWELKDRVNRAVAMGQLDALVKPRDMSMNAYIRNLIRDGEM